MTTSARDTAYEIPHQAPGMKPGVFDAQGIGTTDKSHLIRKLGMIDAITLAQVDDGQKAWHRAPVRERRSRLHRCDGLAARNSSGVMTGREIPRKSAALRVIRISA